MTCAIVPLLAFAAIVVFPVITWVMAIEVLFTLRESPLYTAVIVCAPTVSVEVCRVAVLPLTETGEPIAAFPS